LRRMFPIAYACLLLLRRCFRCRLLLSGSGGFSLAFGLTSTNQRQRVGCIEGELALGDLASGAQANVNAAIARQDDRPAVAQYASALLSGQCWIGFHRFLDLISGQVLLITEGLSFDAGIGNTVLNQEVFDAIDAAFR